MPRNCRITTNLLRRNRSSQTIKKRIVYAAEEEPCYCESAVDSKFRIYRTRWILCQMQVNSTILRQRAPLEHPSFPANPWPFRAPEKCVAAILDCRSIHGMLRVLQETFLKAYLLEMTTLSFFENSRHLASSSPRFRPDIAGNTTVPEDTTYSHSCMMDNPRFPISEVHLGNSQTVHGISQLRKPTSRLKYVQQKNRIFISQCTGSKKLRWQSRLATSWHRDRPWSEPIWRSFSTSMCTSDEEEVSKSNALSNTTDSYEGGSLLSWPMRAFSSHRSFWSCTRSISSTQNTLTEWWRSRFRCTMWPSSIISKWNTYGKGLGRFTQVKITGFCSA